MSPRVSKFVYIFGASSTRMVQIYGARGIAFQKRKEARAQGNFERKRWGEEK